MLFVYLLRILILLRTIKETRIGISLITLWKKISPKLIKHKTKLNKIKPDSRKIAKP